ncbi:hypothetical protein ACVWWO_001922 [Bradyrhizobium sp. F1.13.1]
MPGHILDGSKTWEMRSGPTRLRGPFALIRAGASEVAGVATLANVGWVLPPNQMLETRPLHRIPFDMLRSGAFETLNVPWILTNPKRLARPASYEHSGDAVDWVDLPDAVVRTITVELTNITSADLPHQTKH